MELTGRNLVTGYWGVFPGVQCQERDTNLSPPSHAQVRNKQIYTSIPYLPSCCAQKLYLSYKVPQEYCKQAVPYDPTATTCLYTYQHVNT